MKRYKSFYFLHVVKTGGRFLLNYVIEPITEILEKNGVEVIKSPIIENSVRRNRHMGWHPDIDDSTYIVSIFREPTTWSCSWFTHIYHQRNNLLNLDKQASVIKSVTLNKDDLFLWLEKERNFNNYQSKNYILQPDKNNSSINKEIDIFHQEGNSVDIDLLYSRLERVNLLIKQNNLKKMDYNDLIKKISTDLGIDIDYRVPYGADRFYQSNPSSQNLYKSLNDSDKDYINSIMDIDKKVYDSRFLFWNENDII